MIKDKNSINKMVEQTDDLIPLTEQVNSRLTNLNQLEGLPCLLVGHKSPALRQKSSHHSTRGMRRNRSKRRAPWSRPTRRTAGNRRKRADAFVDNVVHMCISHGIDMIGFMTLTFAHPPHDASEAAWMFAKLWKQCLKRHYGLFVKVVERSRDGRLHIHAVVTMSVDIRTGYEEDPESHVPLVLPEALVIEERKLAKLVSRYGFGIVDLRPISKNPEQLANYCAKDIRSGIRDLRDEGSRMYSMSRGVKFSTPLRSNAGESGRKYRKACHDFAQMMAAREGWPLPISFEAADELLGKGWASAHFISILEHMR